MWLPLGSSSGMDEFMYAFLLVLGAVITATGTAMMAAGFAGQSHAFDSGIVTPGMVAFVGGLILIALGLAVRALQRIESALLARPMPSTARLVETVLPSAAVEQQAPVAARIPFPPKPKTEPRPQPAQAGTMAAPAPAETAEFERVREKFPRLAPVDNAPLIEETEVSLLPNAPAARAEETIAAAGNGAVIRHTNGAAPASSAAKSEREKISVFETFWPKGQRSKQGAQPIPIQSSAAPQLEAFPQTSEPRIDVAPSAAPAVVQREVARAVSVLKSGVVDGMAYTLYSDGSIEAQLPQGTLRFSSINELRNHIEQTS
jgi:hypothetical protein